MWHVKPNIYQRRNNLTAFTLLELVAVMGVAVILLTLTLPSFTGWNRVSRVRTASAVTCSGVELARSVARTFAKKTEFHIGNVGALPPTAYYAIVQDGALIGRTNYLPEGLVWTGSVDRITFRADGSLAGPANRIVFTEIDEGTLAMTITVSVSRVTGSVSAGGL